jgi:hypothetical protein
MVECVCVHVHVCICVRACVQNCIFMCVHVYKCVREIMSSASWPKRTSMCPPHLGASHTLLGR